MRGDGGELQRPVATAHRLHAPAPPPIPRGEERATFTGEPSVDTCQITDKSTGHRREQPQGETPHPDTTAQPTVQENCLIKTSERGTGPRCLKGTIQKRIRLILGEAALASGLYCG